MNKKKQDSFNYKHHQDDTTTITTYFFSNFSNFLPDDKTLETSKFKAITASYNVVKNGIWKQDGKDGPGSLTWFFEIALANFFFFFGRFQRRIYKNFFMSVQCKKPPFTNTMFIDRSKFQEQFWKGSLKENFYEIISKSDQ